MRHGHAVPGSYEIEPRSGEVFTVWCDKDGRDYLPLCKTGGDHNFGQWTLPGTAQPMRTSYTKVRIDPNAMLLDIGDMAFAATTGGPAVVGAARYYNMPLGVAADCTTLGSATGRGNIDLNGTPFTIAGMLWYLDGYRPAGSVSVNGEVPRALNMTEMFPVTGKSIAVTGGGYCGAAGPYGYNSNLYTWASPQHQPAVKVIFTGAQTCLP